MSNNPSEWYLSTIRKLSEDQRWLASELHRIDPNCHLEGNESTRMRALEILVVELRNERDALNL